MGDEPFHDPSFAATVSPSFVDGWLGMLNGHTSKVSLGVLPALWTLTGPVSILGGLPFGIADVPLSHLPRRAGILLAARTELAPMAGLLPLGSQPKTAIPTGPALAWLGYALWAERPTQTSQPNNRMMETV
jgi:hypothetical protein